MDKIITAINDFIGNSYITSILISSIPLIELKGAICFARASGLDFFNALWTAYLGSTIVFIPIFFLLRPILNALKKIKFFNKFALKCENYVQKKADNTLKKRENSKMTATRIKQITGLIFVAIPLPMTGVWTGTALAVFMGLKFKDTIWPIAVGNLIAGLIISVLAHIFLDYIDYIIYGLFGLAIILLIVTILKVALTKPKEDKAGE